MEERLKTWPRFDDGDLLVIDPDSRLSQLGLLPVATRIATSFLRAVPTAEMAPIRWSISHAQWVASTFEVQEAGNYVEPEAGPVTADIAVSFGVGENAEKRIGDPFEEELLRSLVASGKSVLVDQGAGGEESDRVRRLCERVPGVQPSEWAYAPFAYAIRKRSNMSDTIPPGSTSRPHADAVAYRSLPAIPQSVCFNDGVPTAGPIDIIKVVDREPAQVLDAALQYLTL